MRRAKWRSLPEEPNAILPCVPKVLGETATLLLFFALACAAFAWKTGLIVLLGVAPFAAFALLLLPYQSPRPHRDLLTLPLPSGSFPVGVTVRLFRDPTGSDDAVASFVDGWLHVEGRRTSFSLRATDARFEISASDGSLVGNLPGGQTVRVTPALFVGSSAGHSDRVGPIFVKAAEAWLRERVEVPGTPILPPLEAQPQAYARTLVRAALVFLTCLAALGAVSHLAPEARTFVLFVGLLALATATPVYALSRILFLRRIDTGTLRPHERRGLIFPPPDHDRA